MNLSMACLIIVYYLYLSDDSGILDTVIIGNDNGGNYAREDNIFGTDNESCKRDGSVRAGGGRLQPWGGGGLAATGHRAGR